MAFAVWETLAVLFLPKVCAYRVDNSLGFRQLLSSLLRNFHHDEMLFQAGLCQKVHQTRKVHG